MSHSRCLLLLAVVCLLPLKAFSVERDGVININITVWLPTQKVLFSGCMVKTSGAKSLGNTKEADIEAWPNSLQKLFDAYPEAEVVVPGHGAQGGRELIAHTIELWKSYTKSRR